MKMGLIRSLLGVGILLCNNAFAIELQQESQGGEVLIFPFFTTENGWDSYVKVRSPAGSFAKVLKLRVRDAVDGHITNSFNIYLGYHESLSVAITQNDEGNSLLRIFEGHCMVADDLSFAGIGADLPLGANTGSLEVYTLGYYRPYTGDLSEPHQITCEDLAASWADTDNPTRGAVWDNPELIMGGLDLLNVKKGLAASYVATPLTGFYDEEDYKRQHTSPAHDSPNLAETQAVITVGNGAHSKTILGDGIDAVAEVLAGTGNAIENDVITVEEIDASTDWVISYPLAGYKNYKQFTVLVDGVERYCDTFGLPPVAEMPAVPVSHNYLVSWESGKTKYGGGITTIKPITEAAAAMCSAVNVISFDKDSILAPEGAAYLTPLSGVTAGSASILSWRVTPVGKVSPPNPILGFRLTTYVNGTLDGGSVLANYAMLKKHTH